MKCRYCDNELTREFIDLVNAPPSNSFLKPSQLNEAETYYPLKLFVCEKCFLVQLEEFKKNSEIFSEEYVYYSSFSTTWLAHCKAYVEMIIPRLGLNKESFIVEIASNDGYLLQYFKENKIPCLGIEPTAGTANAARKKGIETVERFFGTEYAKEMATAGRKADLILGNNVLAHTPYLNDFIKGLSIALKDNGTITLEFPHLLQLITNNQFDTIYHEHFSYFSLLTLRKIFGSHGLKIYDAEELPTHGGSLRIYTCHAQHIKIETENVNNIISREKAMGLDTLEGYKGFQAKADNIKNDFLNFLIEAKAKGKTVIAYGAAAKGNTLLNYCGIKKDLIKFVVDKSPHKQGLFLPGSHIPVVHENLIKENKPDYLVIFPWNIKEEIVEQLDYIFDWGGQFIVTVPKLELV